LSGTDIVKSSVGYCAWQKVPEDAQFVSDDYMKKSSTKFGSTSAGDVTCTMCMVVRYVAKNDLKSTTLNIVVSSLLSYGLSATMGSRIGEQVAQLTDNSTTGHPDKRLLFSTEPQSLFSF